MLIEIKMPALSPTMEHGTLLQWRVSEGARVVHGEVLAEIETDKSVLEIESPAAGVLARQLFEAGTDEIPVGSTIAVLSNDEADSNPSVEKGSALKTSDESVGQKCVGNGHATSEPDAIGHRLLASPLAKSLAKRRNIDPALLSGSGPNGRVIKCDVENAFAAGNKDSKERPFRNVELSRVRKAIAQRLQQSKQNIPHFYLSMDVELDNLLALREELNNSCENLRLSINDFILRACALSLKKCPKLNAHFINDSIREFRSVDIAVATSLDDGLVTPVIHNADQLTLQQISTSVKELTTKAKAGKLLPEEYQGGTFTLSNMGMFRVAQFDAIINPPQVAILAVGAASRTPIVVQDAIVPATVMRLTLSCDHRVIDGKEGSELLTATKEFLEDSETLI